MINILLLLLLLCVQDQISSNYPVAIKEGISHDTRTAALAQQKLIGYRRRRREGKKSSIGEGGAVVVAVAAVLQIVVAAAVTVSGGSNRSDLGGEITGSEDDTS